MAVMMMFSIRDDKAESFQIPVVFPTKGVMTRALADAVNKTGSTDLYATHPSDFSVYHVADFDSDSGVVTPLAPVVLVHKLSDLVLE